MDTTTTTTDEAQAPASSRRVRADLAAGSALIATVIVGNLLWHASDSSILAAFGAR